MDRRRDQRVVVDRRVGVVGDAVNAPHVPAKYRANCEQCTLPLDVRANGVGQFVEGVAINRAQGGANMIALKRPLNRWICRVCIDLRRSGHEWDQPSLFDET